MHFEVDAFTSPPDYQQITTDLYAWLETKYFAMVPVSYDLDDLTVTGIAIPGQPLGQGIEVVPGTGFRAVSDEGLSAGLCEVAALHTGIPKRWARGRMFLPPALSTVEVGANGTWHDTDPYMVACKAFMDLVVRPNNVGNNTYSLVVYSPHQLLLQNAKPWNTVVGYSMDGKQHFLRSRVSAP